ncbi:MAG: carboxyl-terminal processing protease [Halioglobus sp.]|jgi:carboxyl-terminal processing protease
MNGFTSIKTLLTSSVVALLMISPAHSAEEEPSRLPLDELRTFADVFNQIRTRYVEEVDDSTLLEYAVKGMLMGLDPHSAYLTQDAFDQLKNVTSGEFSGLGLEVGMEDGYVKVISPIDGSPAAEAGLMSGDVILKLDQSPLQGVSLNDAIIKMRGEKGTTIELLIGRPGTGQPFEVIITRDTIKVASVRQRVLEEGYGYLRVSQFQKRTGQDVAESLEKLTRENQLKGLVLDLRNNPGGVLQASVDVSDLFLDGGTVVYTEGRAEDSKVHHNAKPGDASEGIPIIVLINGGSASASEIVAGALQDHRRAVIMGTKSFGKGSVQTIMPMTESRAIKLTTARYFTPKGRSIQALGIVPDILVERAEVKTLGSGKRVKEADLSRHLDNKEEKADHDQAVLSRKAANELISTDNQLYEALTLLKGLNILGFHKQKLDTETLSGAANTKNGES